MTRDTASASPDLAFMSRRSLLFVFVALAALSTAAKVVLSGLGHNIDLESWMLLGELVLDGKIVYAETERSNWGPLWSYLCAGTRYVQLTVLRTDTFEDFHRLMALLLSCIDVAIGALLFRYRSWAAAALFLLNPVSLLITGFHSHFENVAIVFGFGACLLLDKKGASDAGRFGVAMVLLGLSLVSKHVLIFLPLWFFFRPHQSRAQRVFLLVPFAVFAVSFVPVLHDERALEGVFEHVLHYDSVHLDGFFPYLMSAAIPLPVVEALFSRVPVFSGFQFLWFAAMMATGFSVRRKTYQEQLFIYLVAMVVFASAIANQYLVIPLVTCAVYWRHFTVWWYVGVTTIYLLASPVNVGMLPAMARYSELVIASGLDRWHSITALFFFLALYWIGNRWGSALALPRWLFPEPADGPLAVNERARTPR